MEGISNGLSSTEKENLDRLFQYVKDEAQTSREIRQLSEASFEIWIQDTFTAMALKLGYTLSKINQFLINLGFAISTGFREGWDMAKKEGELSRKRIERRFK